VKSLLGDSHSKSRSRTGLPGSSLSREAGKGLGKETLEMQGCYLKGIVPRFVLLCYFLICPVVGSAGADESEQWEYQLLSIGQPGPKAVDLQVWTEKAEGETAKTEGPETVRMKCSAKAHLTAIYLSPGGDVIVLLPSKAIPVDSVLPNKEYTLFGPGSPIKLKPNDMAKDARIIFFVSSVPLQIAPLEVPSDELFLRIPQSSPQGMKMLVNKLTSLSRDPKFNREVLALKDTRDKGTSLNILGLPQDVTSDKPVGVTGVAGAKDKIPEAGKE
jgi:hypothetical protein